MERLCRELARDESFVVIKSATQFELVSSQPGFFCGPPGEGRFAKTLDRDRLGPVLQKFLHRKLLMLLEARDFVGYRVTLNLQPVLLRGFMVQPVFNMVPTDRRIGTKLDIASHEVAEFLIQNGFTTIDEVDSCGWSPLHYAALRGEPLLLQSLLEQRANPNHRATKANAKYGAMKGIVALDLCLRHKNNECCRLLLSAKAMADGGWLLASASWEPSDNPFALFWFSVP